eukprot:363947-Chlamydomonas_euryale.AAC.6
MPRRAARQGRVTARSVARAPALHLLAKRPRRIVTVDATGRRSADDAAEARARRGQQERRESARNPFRKRSPADPLRWADGCRQLRPGLREFEPEI